MCLLNQFGQFALGASYFYGFNWSEVVIARVKLLLTVSCQMFFFLAGITYMFKNLLYKFPEARLS